MGFIKEWWHWLLLGLVIITLLVFRFFIISGKISEANKERRAVQSNAKEVKNLIKSIDNKELPTSGDIQRSDVLQSQLIAERDTIEKMWRDSSAGLELKHNQSTLEYVNFLYKKCEEMCWQLAHKISRLRGVPEDIIAQALQGRKLTDIPQEVLDKMYWPCDLAEHHLVEFIDAGSFRTIEETNVSWIRYLISRRIHEVVGSTSVEVDSWEVKEVKNADPVKEKTKQLRTVEQLGLIEFSDENLEGMTGRRASIGRSSSSRFGGNIAESELPGEGYYKIYPVDINVVGHICVIQELINNFLKSKDILFVLKKVSISRYEDKDTQAGVSLTGSRRTPASMGTGMPRFVPDRPEAGVYPGRIASTDIEEKKPWPSSLNLNLSTEHEPPVQAILSYEIYRFGDFEKKNETIEDGTGN